MSQQRHVIKRQTVEITLAKKEDAWPIQQTLSRIFQQHFPAMLDRCLSELSHPDCLHRIDRLELDLGELDASRLEADILESIEVCLRQALHEFITLSQFSSTAIHQADPMQAHFELFEHFVREGCLPWWADSSQSHMPEKSFTTLLNNHPQTLTHLLVRLIQEPLCLQRLISYFGDNHLLAMMALLTKATEELAISLFQTLQAVQALLHRFSAVPVSRLRATLWQSLLQVAIAGEPPVSRHAEFLTAVTARWARLQGISHKALVSCIQQLSASSSAINNPWLQAIKPPILIDPRSAKFAAKVISKRYKVLKKRFNVYLGQPPKPPREPLAGDITTALLPPQLAHKSVESRRFDRPSAKSNISPDDQTSMEPTDDKQTLSDTDALYINNAGLCILWPFLGSFFERLELMKNGHFHNLAAKQCAVSLLHYLATEELMPLEYWLPFNKLLCGMSFDEVFDYATLLTTTQIEACDELLSAVINSAPILNNMSLNGFRGSFLLRPGVLSAGPGSWLLRVERETYDLVLDRFPWSWQWLKLPWMEYPLRVEW